MSPLCFHDHLGPTLGEFFIPNELTKSHFLARYLDVPGSGWINGLDQWVISPTYKWDIIRFYIPPDPITFDPSTSRDGTSDLPSWNPGRCSFFPPNAGRNCRTDAATTVSISIVDQHCAAFKTSPFQPQARRSQNTSVRPAAQKYSMASPSASPSVPEMVGGWLSFNPFEKSTEEMGIMKTQTFGVKIKNTWKHHLEKWGFFGETHEDRWKFESSDGPLLCRALCLIHRRRQPHDVYSFNKKDQVKSGGIAHQ